eukprot:752110-Hanusia_phi.AAC.1
MITVLPSLASLHRTPAAVSLIDLSLVSLVKSKNVQGSCIRLRSRVKGRVLLQRSSAQPAAD